MNETRIRSLAAERKVELTKKMLKYLLRRGIDLDDIIQILKRAELKGEDVLAYPDFNCLVGLPVKERPYDIVICQSADGRAIRVVGCINRNRK